MPKRISRDIVHPRIFFLIKVLEVNNTIRSMFAFFVKQLIFFLKSHIVLQQNTRNYP